MATEIAALQLAIPAMEMCKNLYVWIKKKLRERDSQQLHENLEKDIDVLFQKVGLFEGFLQSAANHPDQNPTSKRWLEDLKEILYDAEDILDEYATDMAVQEIEAASVTTVRTLKGAIEKVRENISFGKTCTSSNRSAEASDPSKFEYNITSVINKLDDLGKTRADLGINVVDEAKVNQVTLKGRETTSTLDRYPIVGRDDDTEKIKQSLLQGFVGKEENLSSHPNKNHNQQPTLSVLAITGMGGMGKTTLARLLFNDADIGKSFHLKVWVCVSDSLEKDIIIRKTINSICATIGKEECTRTSLEGMEQELFKLVQGKRLLLVLDDIWNQDMELWDSLLSPFQASCKVSEGITILITTRFIGIAKAIPDCMAPVHLQGLKEEELWEVVKFHAFRSYNMKNNNRERLEMVGKGILERLKGSPLAAKSIGRLLASKYTIEHWENVVKRDLHALEQNRNDIIPILRVSYEYLPRYLKQCLIYFSLFPKNHIFRKSEIVNIWMAHNCIQFDSNKDVKRTGEEYLDFLVDRTFLEHADNQDAAFSFPNEIHEYDFADEKYCMHNLIHDLIQSVSTSDCHWLHNKNSENETEISKSIRHVSFRLKDNVKDWHANVLEHSKLRTLIIFGGSITVKFPDISNMRCLRVLAFKGCIVYDMPESIGNLKHLRLLSLPLILQNELPKSLGRLHNLRVLDLPYENRKSLPLSLTRLVNLRHISCDPELLSHLEGIRKLTSLQSLPKFCVKGVKGQRISELKELNKLHGSLEIRNLKDVQNKEEAERARLHEKVHLRQLKLIWVSQCHVQNHFISPEMEEEFEGLKPEVEEQVLEGLKPCEQLKALYIKCYIGRKLPGWMSDSFLKSLEIIDLAECRGMKMLFPYLGKMRFLRTLRLSQMECLTEMEWHTSNNDGPLFPALLELEIKDCPNMTLVQLPSTMTSLVELSIDSCPKLISCHLPPAPVALKYLKIIQCSQITSVYFRSPVLSIERMAIHNCPHFQFDPLLQHLCQT